MAADGAALDEALAAGAAAFGSTLGAALTALPEGVFAADAAGVEFDLFADAAPAFTVLTDESEAPDAAVLFALDADAF
ncbi:hypothetical protein [Thalassospira marina]|uniref:hypothetical protein n=1 Tax=Thalassospira marina TaxID=2048283 RepID=UPI0012FF2C21|nr:hypothetical protein [Thalassospira marina]